MLSGVDSKTHQITHCGIDIKYQKAQSHVINCFGQIATYTLYYSTMYIYCAIRGRQQWRQKLENLEGEIFIRNFIQQQTAY